MTKQKNILFVHYGNENMRSSEQSLLDLMTSLDSRRFRPFLWTNNPDLHAHAQNQTIHSQLDELNVLFTQATSRLNLMAWRKQIRAAHTYIEDADIDLVHVNGGEACQWMSIAAKSRNIPMVTQLHRDYSSRETLAYGFHFSPRVITASRPIARALMADCYPLQRLCVVPSGINVHRLNQHAPIDAKGHLGIPMKSFLFATSGSLNHTRGVDRVLSALRHLTLEYPHVHLLVLGDGPARRQLELMAEHMHLTEHVHFVGNQHNTHRWLQCANAYISGARHAPYAKDLAYASLAELAIVAPCEGSIPEIIKHKKNGLLYKNAGIGPMVKAMRAIIQNPTFSKAIAVRAKAHVLTHYTTAHTTRRIEHLYQKMTTEPVRPQTPWWRGLSPLKSMLTERVA
ncbi:glycosyltransferase family 4 protein [Vibrio paucivorans]|uniref:Glycosyltransferase family 4 protein n=1 Tax=Vibrio paucivorans TaxID=2829489 RepID=A0A9X3HPR4_9VIBR|nr:glycosyltransferase family 4 protein [Vibrio paucivorans]MCW8332995.1 glycosyltransferase family 4 protein [Vibrio paucivorans]